MSDDAIERLRAAHHEIVAENLALRHAVSDALYHLEGARRGLSTPDAAREILKRVIADVSRPAREILKRVIADVSRPAKATEKGT